MKNKLFSIFTALAMVLGILVAPFTSAKAADVAKYENSTNKIVIHKILFKNSSDYDNWKPEEHKTSGKIDNIKGYFGDSAEEIAGVAYDIYKEEEATDTNVSNADKLNTEFNTNEFQKGKYYSVVNSTLITKDNKGVLGTDELQLDNGSYVIVENSKRTTYQDPTTGQTVSKQGKAIPVRITLPAALPEDNKSGVLHLYPKNTTVDSPDTEKNFSDRISITDVNDTSKQNAKKDEANYRVSGVGQQVPYTVETAFKPNSNFEHAYWNDQMTKGLTFDQSNLDAMKIYVNGEDKTDSFDKSLDGNGFKVTLKDMTLVNGKDKNVTVRIEYTAKLNENSKIDIPESNDVTFHYGNNPSEGNTPKPQTPKDKKIKVTKTFADGVKNKEPESLLVQLYNANTGAKVGDPVDLAKEQTKWSHEWNDLDDKYQYKVVEVTTGYEVVYGLGNDGEITIKNNEEDNPTPKNPEEPKVIRYGKKFVKADEKDGTRLKGAKFVVRGEEGKYLVKKTSEELSKELESYKEALAKYDVVYKNEKASQDDLDALLQEVKTTAEALNNPYKWANAANKTETLKLANIVTLESDANGKFEIKDLQVGTYNLEEVVAPDDYSIRESVIPFTVGKGTYSSDADGVVYEGTDKVVKAGNADAMRVDNRKLTIPQTGGIGSLIFIVAGVAIMAFAFVAYKRSEAREA
ncbi:pilin N-terminal domain-containing protein [Anaerococcus tetradius]|uniref:pilin N-terminal domain-containing protein n=1 Tax=Anaerococcus tetradius TaxID=33036 RepID=UPI0023EFFF56|nr:pilin N-terminal domain-containing protein [Anaerococcus tetradius]